MRGQGGGNSTKSGDAGLAGGRQDWRDKGTGVGRRSGGPTERWCWPHDWERLRCGDCERLLQAPQTRQLLGRLHNMVSLPRTQLCRCQRCSTIDHFAPPPFPLHTHMDETRPAAPISSSVHAPQLPSLRPLDTAPSRRPTRPPTWVRGAAHVPDLAEEGRALGLGGRGHRLPALNLLVAEDAGGARVAAKGWSGGGGGRWRGKGGGVDGRGERAHWPSSGAAV